MEALARAGVSFDCGGNGTCGKCRIRVLSGSVPVTDADRAFFSEAELAEGWRLGCRVTAQKTEGGSDAGEGMVIFAEDTKAGGAEDALRADDTESALSTRDYSFAIDIGTTTIAVAAVDMADGRVFDTFTCFNSQRMYGADVASRIAASNNGFGPRLRGLVIEDINHGIDVIMSRNRLAIERCGQIILAGNTVMGHIFAGLTCEGLGMAPFTPVTLDAFETGSGLLLPGISAFVGADALVGMYAAGGYEKQDDERLTLFIDLGTNGEMALGNSERILVTSVAAGPAFEGGNISCGCAGIEGAICDVELSDADDEEPIRFRLIGNESDAFVPSKECAPAGICGSGVIALMAELLDEGVADRTGLLDERLKGKIRLAKNVTFTQKDIRELQLAKAAVRTGIETLMNEYGATYDDIGRVCLAGSFGKALNVGKAVRIGLIPEELKSKCAVLGNTALEGAAGYLRDDGAPDKIQRIREASKEVVLADTPYFAENFLRNMDF